jgi:phage repressor protein C with HTH and peptisase S24 domain
MHAHNKYLDLMSLGKRIKNVRGNVSQKEFGAKFDVTPNTLRRYETDITSPTTDFVSAISEAHGINPMWMFTGEGPMRKEEKPVIRETITVLEDQPSCFVDQMGQAVIPQWENPDHDMFDYIPMAETELSAGGGCFVISEEIEGYYAFRKSWVSSVASSKKNLVLMRIVGDSMAPTIQSKDTVLIDTGRISIKEGMIYALRFDNTVMIKRLAFRPGGKILIISDNRNEFDPYEVEQKDLIIIGQVIFFSRAFVDE